MLFLSFRRKPHTKHLPTTPHQIRNKSWNCVNLMEISQHILFLSFLSLLLVVFLIKTIAYNLIEILTACSASYKCGDISYPNLGNTTWKASIYLPKTFKNTARRYFNIFLCHMVTSLGDNFLQYMIASAFFLNEGKYGFQRFSFKNF